MSLSLEGAKDNFPKNGNGRCPFLTILQVLRVHGKKGEPLFSDKCFKTNFVSLGYSLKVRNP